MSRVVMDYKNELNIITKKETIIVTNSGYLRTVTPTTNFIAVKSMTNLSDADRQPFVKSVGGQYNLLFNQHKFTKFAVW